MHYLYVDFETYYDRDLTLKRSTLRNYLSRTHPLGASIAEDDGEIFWFAAEPRSHAFPPSLLQHLRDRSLDPDWTVVAHNAAFDVRVWRYCLGLPQPQHVHCTLELACAAYPGQPGGYSLGNLSTTLNLGGAKIDINLLPGKYTDEELDAYCKQDTLLCRNLHHKCISRLHPDEVAIAELCNDIRSKHLLIDTGKVIDSVRQMSSDAAVSAAAAVGALGDDVGFGWENDGAIRSVKPQVMKRLLLDNLGFDTQSISRKKIDPEKLRANPAAAEALRLVEATNKTLSHKRRIGVFINAPEVDMELGYFRAMTGRFSSPQVGGAKGINGHNLPKRQKALAKIVRSLFRLPRDKCWVRADLANVEYRIEAWLFGAEAPNAIFANDVLADPYASFWFMATGQRCSKTVNVAARQLAKAAVLGLGFLMGLARWCEELMRGIADGMLGVTLADMESLCQANGWGPPTSRYVKAIQTKLRAPWQIIAVANNTRELFHKIHPEFRLRTMWIDQTVAGLLRTQDADRYLDEAYALPAAPDRTRLGLSWAPDCFGPGTKSVQLTCGVWPTPTVTWRDLRMLETKHGGYCLHCMHASKGMRPLTPNLMSENPTQSAARNALCKGQLELRRMGYQYQYSVHDEVLLMVDRNPTAIHAARDALLRVFGPGNTLGYGWAVVIDPSEITVTESLHEEPMRDWNNMDLEHLP
jgi:hypothetical protein